MYFRKPVDKLSPFHFWDVALERNVIFDVMSLPLLLSEEVQVVQKIIMSQLGIRFVQISLKFFDFLK